MHKSTLQNEPLYILFPTFYQITIKWNCSRCCMLHICGPTYFLKSLFFRLFYQFSQNLSKSKLRILMSAIEILYMKYQQKIFLTWMLSNKILQFQHQKQVQVLFEMPLQNFPSWLRQFYQNSRQIEHLPIFGGCPKTSLIGSFKWSPSRAPVNSPKNWDSVWLHPINSPKLHILSWKIEGPPL